jgi:hypothetical protein
VARYSLSVLSILIPALALAAGPKPSEPDFRVPQSSLKKQVSIVIYGDIRFTDPAETDATNPKVRRWIVEKIASEKPAAIFLSGDVPWHGNNPGDYAVFRSETQSWRQQPTRVYPSLGNHEIRGDEKKCLENWWTAFPELRGLRYYSVQLGDFVYALTLDTNQSLLPGSDQLVWVRGQLASLPSTIRFVFFNLHHPPVVDVQTTGDGSHNGRPNEASLADLLAQAPQKSRVRFIVGAGHIHNYERLEQDDIVYLVSGGGGAKPVPVDRHPSDFYQDKGFPNYHYVRIAIKGKRLRGSMFRVENPDGSSPRWARKDHFEIIAP